MNKLRVLVTIGLLAVLAAACSSHYVPLTPTPDPLVIQGEAVFKVRCAACHALQPDKVIIGPSLAGVATRAGTRMPGFDAGAYIRLSILRPDAYLVPGFNDVMPKDLGQKLTSDDLDAVIAFLLTQK